ncbi:peptidoglycan DD-metalloendopeptidase family protein [Candidatus Ruthia endofausta]|nr:peptidoglycan DD-metalloendopeptidase family protein [Candidatus Ruthia endofausta]
MASAPAYTDNNTYHFTVKRGDSLSQYFSKLGLSNRLLANLLFANKNNKKLNQLNIGHKLTIRLHNNRRFKSLTYQLNRKTNLNIVLNGNYFSTILNRQSKQTPSDLSITVVSINHSFGADAQKAGIGFSTISLVVKELSWQLNFNTDLKKGDRFIIVNGFGEKPVAIIYQSIIKNKSIEAFAYKNKHGHINYFNRFGHSLNSSFLRAPLKYKRISSKFQLRRYHPILKTWRPHRAVDYAANYGTPVYSTANGVITTKGRKGALGKVIIIQHSFDYTTVYAHLSRYANNLYKGRKVKKGQIIGYVGSTGRSTGPHLHYELHYKGKRRNPLTHKLPAQKNISCANLQNFKTRVNKVLSNLELDYQSKHANWAD